MAAALPRAGLTGGVPVGAAAAGSVDALRACPSAFEAYAVGLHGLLGDLELVTRCLELLLHCSDGPSTSTPATAGHAGTADAVISWCLSDPRKLCEGGAEAASRTLLLQRALASGGGISPEVSGNLLEVAPEVLAEASEPIAERLAGAVALCLRGEEASAAEWLAALRRRGVEVITYARAAQALLANQKDAPGRVFADAWEVAEAVATGPDTQERRVCIQRLLPTLVGTTPPPEAAARLARCVAALLHQGGGGIAAAATAGATACGRAADALGIAVSFHELLLGHWRLSSLDSDHDELGVELLVTGFRCCHKEFAGVRRHARFLLQTVVQSALTSDAAAAWFARPAAGLPAISEVAAAWRSFWELFDTLQEYSSHLLKAGWAPQVERMMRFLGILREAPVASAPGFKGWPPALLSPQWLEVLFAHALAHDNDTVQKFVVGQLVTLDQGTACLSDAFVLHELLPRLSQSIDILYPRTDVHQAFERRVAAFFSTFVARHPRGSEPAARNLLLALTELRGVHHTPLRVLLGVFREVEARGALGACEAFTLTEQFFSGVLPRMPVSLRPILASLLLCAVERLASEADAGEVAVRAAEAAAAVPDALLDELRAPLAALARSTTAASSRPAEGALQLLRGLTSPAPAPAPPPAGVPEAELHGRQQAAMPALRLALGAVRLLWATVEEGATPTAAELVWEVVEPILRDIHRRSYLPQRAVVTTLFSVAYATSLLPNGQEVLARHGEARAEARAEALAFVAVRCRALMAEAPPAPAASTAAGTTEEGPWLWLYCLVLEKLWAPGLAEGEALMVEAVAKLSAARGKQDPSVQGALCRVAAVSVLGALAPRVPSEQRAADLFLVLWQAQVSKPPGMDDRFSICDVESLGSWDRLRLEEHEDLHRTEREGAGRLLEWRDLPAVFLAARWRALAALAMREGLLEALAATQPLPGGTADRVHPWPLRLALDVLAEHETLLPQQLAYWAVVARHIVYPLLFHGGSAPEEEQIAALQSVCSGLGGIVMDCTGDSSTFMPRGCLTELAGALCDQRVLDAEHRLFHDRPAVERPLTATILKLLSLGEAGVGITRGVAVPLLVAVLGRPPADGAGDSSGSLQAAAELLVNLLLHREAVIIDGAFSHAPEVAAGAVDAAGPGSLQTLDKRLPCTKELCAKFSSTPGLSRVLVLSALDTLADRSVKAGAPTAPLVSAALQRLLTTLSQVLEQLLHPPGAKPAPNRPPTPMPMSLQHRTQLRGWQAVLVLGCRADEATAAMLLPHLFVHLGTPHVPDVRDYQELLGCSLCSRFESLAVEPYLVPALQHFDVGVQVSASLLVICSYLFRRWSEDPDPAVPWQPHVAALVWAALPYMGHNSAYVRGSAAWGLFQILDRRQRTGADGAETAEAKLLTETRRFLETNSECIKMRRRLQPVFSDFDPVARAAIDVLVEKSAVLPDPTTAGPAPSGGAAAASTGAASAATPDISHTFADGDFIPTSTFLNFLKGEVADEMERLWDRTDPSTYPSISEEWRYRIATASAAAAATSGESGASDAVAASVAGPAGSLAETTAGGASGMQRKFVPLTPPPAPCSSPGAAEDGAIRRRLRAPLIVVASLIDKTPNLAGLCRTCEIFNCEALCLDNTKVVHDQTFQSISVTAEKWLPLLSVPRGAALRAHLLTLRRQGYALVGVEQTHNSVMLDQWRFARRTALVLGAEKEGIDAELLPLLDACVEIPQSGQLRSLNVHVSGSLAVWEYTRQQRQAPPQPASR